MGNRNYVVKKDGEIIKELKSLTAAKKIALAESAEVYCDDELLFSPSDADKEEASTVETFDPVEKRDRVEKKIDDAVEMKYRLKALMNVRVSPSLSSRKIATLPPGTIVAVANIKNDWLHLTNGSFILYANGKYAEKVQ